MNYTSTFPEASLIRPRYYLEEINSNEAVKEKVAKEQRELYNSFVSKLRNLSSNLHPNCETQYILLNKRRYMEFSIQDKQVELFIQRSAKIAKPKRMSSLCCGFNKMEAVVRAFTKQGIRVIIQEDWI